MKTSAIAITVEVIDLVNANPIVQARLFLAFIYINFTQTSVVSRLAITGEVVDAVSAGGLIQTRFGFAFVDINSTIFA